MTASTAPPRFSVGDGYASYRGPAVDGSMHRHAAFQVAIAPGGTVAIEDTAGARHRGEVLVVTPMTRHRVLPGTEDLLTYFVDPHLAYADRLRDEFDGIAAAPELAGLREEELRGARTSAELDPRLLQAMAAVSGPGLPMTQVAAEVGLSPQRLRAIARLELGMPLPRWRAWVRLRRAAEALAAGSPLAEAALDAGFADQAHMTRWMREMMGITPRGALAALRPQSREAV